MSSSSLGMTLNRWERLKRLTFVIDQQVHQRRIRTISLTNPDVNDMRFVEPGVTTSELNALRILMYDMGLVSREPDLTANEPPDELAQRELDLDMTKLALTAIFHADRYVDELFISHVTTKLVQRLCRHAYGLSLIRDGWPQYLAVNADGRIRAGIVVKSIDGKIEGRTTGGRRKCPSNQCNGWLVGVHWQTGQQLHICTEGWHYDPTADEVRVIGGGAISARFVSPKPFGVEPLPRREWPSRAALMRTKAWSISTR